MREQNNKRIKWLHIRLTEAEYNQINREFAKTTTGRLSDYTRKILLGKPMIGTYRNKSMDDFMAEMIRLRTELNSIGNNFNQLVKRLHITQQTDAVVTLLLSYELDKRTLLNHIAAIQLFIEKNEEKW